MGSTFKSIYLEIFDILLLTELHLNQNQPFLL